MSFSYYTKEGLKNLRDELNQLKDVERPLASKAIAEASINSSIFYSDLWSNLGIHFFARRDIFKNLIGYDINYIRNYLY